MRKLILTLTTLLLLTLTGCSEKYENEEDVVKAYVNAFAYTEESKDYNINSLCEEISHDGFLDTCEETLNNNISGSHHSDLSSLSPAYKIEIAPSEFKDLYDDIEGDIYLVEVTFKTETSSFDWTFHVIEDDDTGYKILGIEY